jgi:hypothetical protein
MAWTFYNSSGEAMIEDGAMTIANNTNNRVVTATGADPASLNGEANLTFDGTTLTIAGQIAFPASQSANAGANVLDDYEEGTFTPTLHDNSNSDSESVAYSMQVGHYVKIGRINDIANCEGCRTALHFKFYVKQLCNDLLWLW